MCQRCPLQWVKSAGGGMIQDHNLTNFMAHTHVWEKFKKFILHVTLAMNSILVIARSLQICKRGVLEGNADFGHDIHFC